MFNFEEISGTSFIGVIVGAVALATVTMKVINKLIDLAFKKSTSTFSLSTKNDNDLSSLNGSIVAIDKCLAVIVDRLERIVNMQDAIAKSMERHQIEVAGFLNRGCPNQNEVQEQVVELRNAISRLKSHKGAN
jgi:hypothetical protein